MGIRHVALVGDFNPDVVAHRAIPLALARACERLDAACQWEWIHTSSLSGNVVAGLSKYAGIWSVPNSPYANPGGMIDAIRFARTHGIPFLGTCGGFQHALIEYADAIWAIPDPTRTGGDPYATGNPVIAPLSCALVKVGGDVWFEQGSRLGAIYGADSAHEEYHCGYGVNPAIASRLATGALRISARDRGGDIRAIELDGHPFYIATLYQPERSALRGTAHPLVTAFVRSVIRDLKTTAMADSKAGRYSDEPTGRSAAT